MSTATAIWSFFSWMLARDCSGRCSGALPARSWATGEGKRQTWGMVGDGAEWPECGRPGDELGNDCSCRTRTASENAPLFTRKRACQGSRRAQRGSTVEQQLHVCVQIQPDSSRERRMPLADDETRDGMQTGTRWTRLRRTNLPTSVPPILRRRARLILRKLARRRRGAPGRRPLHGAPRGGP